MNARTVDASPLEEGISASEQSPFSFICTLTSRNLQRLTALTCTVDNKGRCVLNNEVSGILIQRGFPIANKPPRYSISSSGLQPSIPEGCGKSLLPQTEANRSEVDQLLLPTFRREPPVLFQYAVRSTMRWISQVLSRAVTNSRVDLIAGVTASYNAGFHKK